MNGADGERAVHPKNSVNELTAKEWETYTRYREHLLAGTSGKFVLIFGEDIIGIYPSEEETITQGCHHLGSVDFFVKHITSVEKPGSFVSNPPDEGEDAEHTSWEEALCAQGKKKPCVRPFPDIMVDFQHGQRTLMPGALVLLSEGEWSAYAVQALFSVVKPLQEEAVIAAYKHDHPEQVGHDFYGGEFTLWLEAQGYVTREWYIEWHVEKKYHSENMTMELNGPGTHLPIKEARDRAHGGSERAETTSRRACPRCPPGQRRRRKQ